MFLRRQVTTLDAAFAAFRRQLGVKRLALVAALVWATFALSQGSWLGEPEPIVPGVDLFRSTDRALVDAAGPVSVYLLRLDPKRVTIASGLSNGESHGRRARRRHRRTV